MGHKLVSTGKRTRNLTVRLQHFPQNGFAKCAVIAGVGTRNYYRKLGYHFSAPPGNFMVKVRSRPGHHPQCPPAHPNAASISLDSQEIKGWSYWVSRAKSNKAFVPSFSQ